MEPADLLNLNLGHINDPIQKDEEIVLKENENSSNREMQLEKHNSISGVQKLELNPEISSSRIIETDENNDKKVEMLNITRNGDYPDNTVIFNKSVAKPYIENIRRLSEDIVMDVINSARSSIHEKFSHRAHRIVGKDEQPDEHILGRRENSGSKDFMKTLEKLYVYEKANKGDTSSEENMIQKDYLSKNHMSIEEDTICGFGCFQPKWIQKYATSRMFLILFSLSQVFCSTYYNYFVGMISTFEKRYALKTKVSGSLMLAEEILPLFLGILVGYFGNRTHRPRLVAVGTLLSAVCCLSTAFPYFIYGSAKHLSVQNVKNETSVQVCKDELSSCDLDERPPTISVIVILLSANFLRGFSNVTLSIIGMPYLDDNTKKKNTPVYFAFTYSTRLLGPLLGYLLSSACLKYYEDPFEDPGYGPEDPRWIGAWWVGFLVQSVLLVIFSLPIVLFPRRLPGFKLPEDPESQVKKGKMKDFLYDMVSTVKRIVKNPVLILLAISAIMKIFGQFGHAVMVPKYIENQFKLSASDANLYSGSTSVACIMISTILGGILVWKFKPSIKRILVCMVATEVALTLGFLVLMVPRCQLQELQQFGKNDEGFILNGKCNENCGCTTTSYTPYCGPDGKAAYFSPCYAGCMQELPPVMSDKEHKVYGNCSCVIDDAGDFGGKITEGYCVDENCWTQALLYIGIFLVLTSISTIFTAAHTILVLRSVHPNDKSVAKGIYETSLSMFGFIPFPPIYGALVDSACLVWGKSCDESGNCWFYDMEKYNYQLHGVSSVFCLMAALCLIILYQFSDRIRNLYEDEDEEVCGDIKLDTVSDSQTKL